MAKRRTGKEVIQDISQEKDLIIKVKLPCNSEKLESLPTEFEEGVLMDEQNYYYQESEGEGCDSYGDDLYCLLYAYHIETFFFNKGQESEKIRGE